MSFRLQPIRLEDHRFLESFKTIFDSGEAFAFGTEGEEFSRINCNGIIALEGRVGGSPAGVVHTDFRVNGGSFGRANSRKLEAFLKHALAQRMPVILIVNSLGVRIMEGRAVFADAFGLVPILTRFRKQNLLITCAVGKCLGLGALVFGMGHYRMGVRGESFVNLTGPEVMSLFFGAKFDFEEFASVERQFQSNGLVHELQDSKDELLKRARHIVAFATGNSGALRAAAATPVKPAKTSAKVEERLQELLGQAGDANLEIFHQQSGVVRAFLIRRGERLLGAVANPPGQANNMMTVPGLKKYSAALDFFSALGIPVLSFLDTPGADPRAEQSDRDIIGAMLETVGKIVEYPHGKMGVIVGRCFGGATVLGFPRTLGAQKTVALEGCTLGIMHESIISRVLAGSPRMKEEWDRTTLTQTPDLRDVISSGVIDELISERELGAHVEDFLRSLEPSEVRKLSSWPRVERRRRVRLLPRKPAELSVRLS
ncbi:MAG: hypothetical protein NDJ89_03695 [Oligoflexia bacterium]|nr:hypothetical protein [Oligoflexia bacterium]